MRNKKYLGYLLIATGVTVLAFVPHANFWQGFTLGITMMMGIFLSR